MVDDAAAASRISSDPIRILTFEPDLSSHGIEGQNSSTGGPARARRKQVLDRLFVGEDLAFVGFDISSQSRCAYPSLTTMVQPFEEAVRMAVFIAIGRKRPGRFIRGEILIREASLCPR